MSHKTFRLYRLIYKFLKDNVGLNPKKFMMDYEAANRKAVVIIWPHLANNIRGCNFHYCQCLRRKAKSLPELSTLIRDTQPTQQALKMFMRLSLIPNEYQDAALDSVRRFLDSHQIRESYARFESYFVKIWLEKVILILKEK